jgi:hypothetical protein
MSKFRLNLLVKILNVLPKSKFILISKIKSRLNFPLGSGPDQPASLVLARFILQATVSMLSPFGPSSLAYSPKGVFPLSLCIPAMTPSLCYITTMWPPPVNFIP